MLKMMNDRVKKLDVWDIWCTKMSVLFAAIVLVKLLPQLINISYPVLIVAVVAFAAKPMYSFWFKK